MNLYSVLQNTAQVASWIAGGVLYYMLAPMLLSTFLALSLVYLLFPAVKAHIIVLSSIVAALINPIFCIILLNASHGFFTPLFGFIIGYFLSYPMFMGINCLTCSSDETTPQTAMMEENPDKGEEEIRENIERMESAIDDVSITYLGGIYNYPVSL